MTTQLTEQLKLKRVSILNVGEDAKKLDHLHMLIVIVNGAATVKKSGSFFKNTKHGIVLLDIYSRVIQNFVHWKTCT